jgi:hypothetical protein
MNERHIFGKLEKKKPPAPFWRRNFSQHDVAKKVGILHCGLGGERWVCKECEKYITSCFVLRN